MKIIKVIVDEAPCGCDTCLLRNGYSAADYYCSALVSKEYKASIPSFGMHDFRRHDCPLVLNDVKSKEATI